MTPRKRQVKQGWKTLADWTTLSAEDEAQLPTGARIGVVLAGVTVPFLKLGEGRWAIESRSGIPASKIVGRRVAKRVPRGGSAAAQ